MEDKQLAEVKMQRKNILSHRLLWVLIAFNILLIAYVVIQFLIIFKVIV